MGITSNNITLSCISQENSNYSKEINYQENIIDIKK